MEVEEVSCELLHGREPRLLRILTLRFDSVSMILNFSRASYICLADVWCCMRLTRFKFICGKE